MKWEVGQEVYVAASNWQGTAIRKCKVTKVGRRYVTAGGHEFDMTDGHRRPKGNFYGWTPMLWTAEEKRRYDSKQRVLAAFKELAKVGDSKGITTEQLDYISDSIDGILKHLQSHNGISGP